MSHSTTLSELFGTIASRRVFLKRLVVMGATIPAMSGLLAACGEADLDDDTPAAAGNASPDASPASVTITESPAGSPTSEPTAATGQLAFAGTPASIDAPASSVYLVGSDGNGMQPVWGWPTAGSHAVYLVWSPDGTRLAFYAHDAGLDAANGGYTALFWLVPDRGETSNLNLAGLLDADFTWGPPSWSPDGRHLYVSMPAPPSVPADVNPATIAGILAIPVDGSANPELLVMMQDLDMQNPILRISPDGQLIAALIDEPRHLVVVRVDDPLTRVEVGDLAVGGFPVWSPDSQRIAFIGQSTDSNGQLYVVNADGTGMTQLTDLQPPDEIVSGFVVADPAWSPDGQQLACTVLHEGTPQVFASAVDGSNTRNLSNYPSRADTGPCWSPDGLAIAFVSQPADAWRSGESPVIRDIHVIQADGTGLRTVAAGVQGVALGPFGEEVSGLPAWRP